MLADTLETAAVEIIEDVPGGATLLAELVRILRGRSERGVDMDPAALGVMRSRLAVVVARQPAVAAREVCSSRTGSLRRAYALSRTRSDS